MSETYIAFGDPIEGHPPDGLRVAAAREAWRAIQARREFTFIEARRVAFVGAPPRPLPSTARTMRCRPGIGPTSAIASGLHYWFLGSPERRSERCWRARPSPSGRRFARHASPECGGPRSEYFVQAGFSSVRGRTDVGETEDRFHPVKGATRISRLQFPRRSIRPS